MSDKNKITVNILGQQYTMKSTSDPDHLKLVAEYVDDKMNKIQDMDRRLDPRHIAVLAGINIADEYFQLKEEYNDLLEIIKNSSNKK